MNDEMNDEINDEINDEMNVPSDDKIRPMFALRHCVVTALAGTTALCLINKH